MKQTKTLHAVLICLMIVAIFTYTATTTLSPLILQDTDIIKTEKIALQNSPKISRKEKPDLISLGDPIDDPKPRKQ